MARKKRSLGAGGNWMDTYGDMVTLLLTFFVCLYSMSTISEETWYKLVQAFNITGSTQVDQIVFAVTEQEGKEVKENMNPGDNIASTDPEGNKDHQEIIFEALFNYLKEYLDPQIDADMIRLEQSDSASPGDQNKNPSDPNTNTNSDQTPKSIFIQLNNSILFEPDKSKLVDGSMETLTEIRAALEKYEPNIAKVIIKGYTADIESVAEAWELSCDRAREILYFFRDKQPDGTYAFPESKLMATGLGKEYPIASNDTEEGRRQNRRVEIVIIPNSADGAKLGDFGGSHFADSNKALIS